MRAPLAHSPHSAHGSALVPLDTASHEKLLYSNPRLLRSSQLGETCPTPCPCVSMALFGMLAGKRIQGCHERRTCDASTATDSKAAQKETACALFRFCAPCLYSQVDAVFSELLQEPWMQTEFK